MNPRKYQGTTDYLGSDATKRKWVVDKMVAVFERFGFEPLETPIIELKETLAGKTGGETANQLFLFKRGDEEIGLRFDQTVPLARVIAQYANELTPKLPYKRYVIGPVFRAEKTQKGRNRQFTQIDIDTVGEQSVVADAEIIALIISVLENLGLRDFRIDLSNRKILNGICQEIDLSETESVALMRLWDKLGKKNPGEVFKEIGKALGDDKSGKAIEATQKLINFAGQKALNTLEKSYPKTKEGILELRQIVKILGDLGGEAKKVKINPLLARGLDYYTGPVFEAVVEKEDIGSIGGGGRYDKLIANLGGPQIPATGFSFGLERLVYVLDKLGLSPKEQTPAKVFVTVFDPKEKNWLEESAKIAETLRKAKINTEMYLGSESLGKQIQIADRKGIPYVLIFGPEEKQKDVVTIKDLTIPLSGAKDKTANQKIVPKSDLIYFPFEVSFAKTKRRTTATRRRK